MSTAARQSGGNGSLKDDVERAARAIAEHLRGQRLKPVDRKVYAMIYDRLNHIHASLEKRPDPDPHLRRRIRCALELITPPMKEEMAWDVADALKSLMPEVAGPDQLYRALVEEKGRSEDSFAPWKHYFPEQDLVNLTGRYEAKTGTFEGASREKAVQQLVTLYDVRNNMGRHDRARNGVRARYLWHVTLLLLVVFALVLGWSYAADGRESLLIMLVVLLAGGFGALLSGAIKLRELGSIVELKGFRSTLLPQIALGAAFAVGVFLVLKTGIVAIKGLEMVSANDVQPTYDDPRLFVVGFISGFSEPFALGILGKVSKLGEEK